MKIGIDARLLERRMTGIGRYLSDLLKELPLSDKENEYILFTYRPIHWLDAPNMRNVPTLDASSQGKLQKLRSLYWLRFTLPRFIKKENIDIFFSPNNILPAKSAARKNVVAIMDVFPLIDPRFHSPLYRAYSIPALKRSARKADHILTISEWSKKDIVKFLEVPPEKVSVTYLSAEKRFTPREVPAEERARLKEKYLLPDKFILYVGVIEKRKNIEGIIRVADMLKEKGDLPVVLVGRPGYGGKELVSEINKRSNMRYCNFVTDEDLPHFYNLASAFFFPSLYEGFGLPVLEAMQSGLPVVTSNRSSLPEVTGDAAITLDPADYKGFAEALRGLLRDEKKWASLRAAGLVRAARFSPEKTARDTVQTFKDCVRQIKNL